MKKIIGQVILNELGKWEVQRRNIWGRYHTVETLYEYQKNGKKYIDSRKDIFDDKESALTRAGQLFFRPNRIVYTDLNMENGSIKYWQDGWVM